MPELPDVEGFRRVVVEHARGQRIDRIEVIDRGVLRNRDPKGFAKELEGCRFEDPDRHGKWLIAHTDGPTLLFHFGMSGGLMWAPAGERHRHDRIVFGLEQGELRYRDMRKLAACGWRPAKRRRAGSWGLSGRMHCISIEASSPTGWHTAAAGSSRC